MYRKLCDDPLISISHVDTNTIGVVGHGIYRFRSWLWRRTKCVDNNLQGSLKKSWFAYCLLWDLQGRSDRLVSEAHQAFAPLVSFWERWGRDGPRSGNFTSSERSVKDGASVHGQGRTEVVDHICTVVAEQISEFVQLQSHNKRVVVLLSLVINPWKLFWIQRIRKKKKKNANKINESRWIQDPALIPTIPISIDFYESKKYVEQILVRPVLAKWNV